MSPRVYHLHLYEEIYTNKITEEISLKDMIVKPKRMLMKLITRD